MRRDVGVNGGLSDDDGSLRRVVVERFGGVEQLAVRPLTLGPLRSGRIRVRVLAASVGATDVAARRGTYILEPRAPMTPGYDLVGEIVDLGDLDPQVCDSRGLRVGARVAACLSRMGAYVDVIDLPDWRLVPVPEGLDTVTAAAVPLDFLTAASLVERHGRVRAGQRVFVQGARGAVGRVAVAMALRAGGEVWGSGSPGSREAIEAAGAHFVDYTGGDVFREVGGVGGDRGVDAILDQQCGPALPLALKALRPSGVYVTAAFAQRPGHESVDGAMGAARLFTSKAGSVGRRRRVELCSVPWEIHRDRAWYRRTLRDALRDVADGGFSAPVDRSWELGEVQKAQLQVEKDRPAGKVVLVTGG